METGIDISVVIPTKRRYESLKRVLATLARQDVAPSEVIIVTGVSDGPVIESFAACGKVRVRVIETAGSVCIQRNAGIRASQGGYVMLCDDDIELPADYLACISHYLRRPGIEAAVTGVVLEQDAGGDWIQQHPPSSLGQLIWTFAFQLGLWGEMDLLPENEGLRGRVFAYIKQFYARRGNGLSLAGWPLVTDQTEPVFETSIYGLGASVVPRAWLLASPYDEVLDENGIGDNYGVALGFPGSRPIHVLTDLHVLHHKEGSNRPDPDLVQLRRVLALDYFLASNARFGISNRLWLRWSIVGFVVSEIRNGNWPGVLGKLRLLGKLTFGANPYLRASRLGIKTLALS